MLERILTLSVRHRWMVVALALLAMAVGGWTALRLPIDAVPDITNKQVQINTTAPALSPVEVEKQVTFPIETALAGIPGLEGTRSLSRNGFSQVTALFAENVDIYFARQQVGERLGEAKAALPEGAEPHMGALSTGLGEVAMWTVSLTPFDSAKVKPGAAGWQADGSYHTPEGQVLATEAQRATYLRTVQDWIIRPQVKGVPGIAGVDAIGGYVKQYQVAPDPQRLAARGLTLTDVAQALERNNTSAGAGYLERRGEAYVVRADGRLRDTEDIAAVPIATRDGTPVLLRDVAAVTLGHELRSGSASENGREVVVGTALMRVGGNSRTAAAAVTAKLDDVAHTLPPDIKAEVVLNRTKLVDATIHTVGKNLAEGALLVIVVLFALLGNIRAALITAAIIPVTMLLTAMGMVEAGISANLMSLGALDFGLIVDGAVIIAENCLRRLGHRQQALGRPLATPERLAEVVAASKEMIRPSVYGQAIIILVYVPLLTFTGVEGKMFQPMALTVITALVAAFVLSLTLVPALVAMVITGPVNEKENRVVAGAKGWYAPVLERALAAPLPWIFGAACLFLASVGLFTRMGQEFIPTLDEQDIAVQAVRIPSTSLSQSTTMQTEVERAVSAMPEVAFVFSKTGTAEMAADPMPPNASDTFIILKPRAQWPDPALPKAALVARIETALGRLPGNAYEFTQPIQMRFNELISGVRSDVAVKLYGDDFEALQASANRIAGVLQGIAGAADVRVDQAAGLPTLDIRVDRQTAARFGLSAQDVQDVVAMAVGGRAAGQVFEGDRRFDVTVRLADPLRNNLDTLRALPVPLPDQGKEGPRFVPLGTVASFTLAEGPNQIGREDGKRRIVIQANVRGRDIGSFVAEAQAQLTSVSLPSGYWVTWGGQFENLAAARDRLAVVVPACFAAIFLLLYGALGSARDAGLVFSGVPLALTGGIAALWLRGMPFSISAAVGFIALSGIAVLNGLVMVSFIRQAIADGDDPLTAIRDGALTRLRPVLMTALVASLGFVPMALATGPGAEVQRPLATVVIGGLISATALTLVVLPALYRRFAVPREAGAGTAVPTLAE
ncbi:CzcA family heavy metal efflux protein [Nitrospirillum viridazoti Y2]|uniref:Cobalt-zinc-cadmium resistance protein CzcA n=1 Tax=Nitrospirillum amazonense TaxID=28077 RepID=A0A560J422_9PROT|nr:CusA/CzcA family heavy metal efflux RND transporter [Nitrospirillum amazonense]EGX99957.1 CzcA family heavy metal efflux protein [Nitrospirillum amazonense Y2]TWB63974.1 cobalt-zinc-cadmium resistance protein CzcA [Nitrospirillum amazonense]